MEEEVKKEEEVIVEDDCNLDVEFEIAVADTSEVYDEDERSVE